VKNNANKTLNILDCTIRDGGYINNWNFEKKFVREPYSALSKSGVDYIELGFHGTSEHFDDKKYGLWRFTKEESIKSTIKNLSGAKIAVMGDYGKIKAENIPEAKNSIVELIRIAAHKNCLQDAIKILEEIKKKGYKVSLNAMGYANYSKADCKNLVKMIKASSLDYIYVADSYGSMFPNQIREFFEPLLNIPNIKVGFHPHNNLQMAFANTIKAIHCGVDMVDSTIYGMGRAAGNLPTEIIISYLENKIGDRYNPVPILNIIDRYFLSMYKENPWGYQLPYMLSGMFKCHPNYAKALVDQHEYTIEDMLKTMEHVKKKNPVGYSSALLDELINSGHIGTFGEIDKNNKSTPAKRSTKNKHSKKSVVPYVNRHNNKDFLILANGPSLKGYKSKIADFISKYDPVVLGANYLGGLFKPDYHAFNNKRRFMEYIDTVAPESKLLIGQYISDEMVREYTSKNYENIYYLDSFDKFDINNGIISTNCRTIAVLLLGVAIVMGAKRIFAAGMDGYKDIESLHFYNEHDEKYDKKLIIERHRWCNSYIAQIDEYLLKNNKEGVHILTPTSYKNFYKGIDNYI